MWAPPLLLTSNFKTPALEVQIPWNNLLWLCHTRDSKQTPVTHLLSAGWCQTSFALLKMVPIISTASSHSTREILWASCAVINKVTTQQAKGTHHNVHATSLFSVFVQDTADLPGNGRSNFLDTWYWSEFVTQLHSAPQLSHSTKLCISQSACVANHIDTAGSNDQVKMLLMSCSYWVSWWLQISILHLLCIYNFLDRFCLFAYSERFPCTWILIWRLLLFPRQWTTPEGTELHRTFITSSKPSSFSSMNQCQCLCLCLAPASSSERKHSVSPTLMSHTP